jgi:hypothetical protein
MPKVYSEGNNDSGVLRGSKGVGKVAKGSGAVKAVTPKRASSMRTNPQGAADSRPSDNDRTQSAR